MMNKMPILYRVGRFILGPIFKWYYKPTIIGKENIPASGAILIVGNHKHLYDQCLSIISTKDILDTWLKRNILIIKNKMVLFICWLYKCR